jgi:hypothetical protein
MVDKETVLPAVLCKRFGISSLSLKEKHRSEDD